MARKVSYGQFCPVAKACEVFAERWTPLIVREMFMGSQRFSDIHRGVPLMSRSLLSKRLQELERAGVVQRVESDGSHDRYALTTAGMELGPIVVQLGQWGKQWTRSDLSARELDPSLLMWDMRRRIDSPSLGGEKVVVYFLYHDAPMSRRQWWLVMDRDEIDLCLVDPGVAPDVRVMTTVNTMTGIWMGDISFGAAVQKGDLQLEGPTKLRSRLPSWLKLSTFADIERQAV